VKTSQALCTLICAFVFSHGLFFQQKQFRSMVRMCLSSLSMVASKFSLFSTKQKSYFRAENRKKDDFSLDKAHFGAVQLD